MSLACRALSGGRWMISCKVVETRFRRVDSCAPLSLGWPFAGRSVIIRQDSQRRIFSLIGLRETRSKEEKPLGTRKPHIPALESLEHKTLMSTGASTAPAGVWPWSVTL